MYLKPRTVDEALAALASEAGATIVAGGTDVFAAHADRPGPQTILDVTAIAGLRAITADDRGVRIGAAATWSDVLAAPLPPAFDGLKAAAREVGAVQIQNVATVAGNLANASPAADGVPPLLTLGAAVEIAAPPGVRTVALEDFLLGPRRTALGPGEMLTAVLVPPAPAAARGAFVKLGSRHSLVISITMAAALVEVAAGRIAAARVAVGAASPVARRLPALEAALTGLTPAKASCRPVTADDLAPLSPIDDVRGSAAYRLAAAAEIARRAVLAAAGVR